MSLISGLLMAATAAAPGASPPPPPIRVVTDRVGDGVRITVLGDAQQPFEGDYALDVSAGTNGNVNHSVQSGRARLEPGAPRTLITLMLANAPAGSWHATLKVTGTGNGGSYTVEYAS